MSHTQIPSVDTLKQLVSTPFDAVEIVTDNPHPFDDIEQFEDNLMHKSVIGDVLIVNHKHNQYPRLVRIAFNGFKCDVESAQVLTQDQVNYAI